MQSPDPAVSRSLPSDYDAIMPRQKRLLLKGVCSDLHRLTGLLTVHFIWGSVGSQAPDSHISDDHCLRESSEHIWVARPDTAHGYVEDDVEGSVEGCASTAGGIVGAIGAMPALLAFFAGADRMQVGLAIYQECHAVLAPLDCVHMEPLRT